MGFSDWEGTVSAVYFGPRLKELREAAGLSQKDVCERTGLTPDGLSKLERGLRLPGWETVIALADVLGVSTEAFRQAPARPAGEKPRRGRPRKTPVATSKATVGENDMKRKGA
jgi:transcriptional regulator with XRE-family HTH domain